LSFISIIIPTYNDWFRLALCLDALSRQTYPDKKFEIIVVNNNPLNKPPDNYVIPVNCTIINETRPGSYVARNTALKIAKGEILGFTDSDCIPDFNWIKNAVDYFAQNKQISRIAGHIELFFKSKELTPAELYEKVYAFKQERTVQLMSSGVTGNMFSYKYIFDTIGNFKEDLLSGGDHEWARRAQVANFKIAYVNNVIVRHPARNRMAQLVTKTKRITGGRMLVGKNKIKVVLGLIKSLKPPFNNYINKDGNDLSWEQKLIVFFIKYYLNIIERYEEFKLAFGKKPLRQ